LISLASIWRPAMDLTPLLVLMAVVSPLKAQRGAEASKSPGPSSGWSMPSPVIGVPPGSALKWPSAAQFGETVYVSGNVLPTTRLRSGPHPMMILRAPGAPLELPVGNFEFAYPKGVFDSKGVYHLVWGEPANPDSVTWRYGALITSLWHAAFEHGHWGAPSKIIDAVSVHWSTEAGSMAVDSRDRLHIVAPTEIRPGAVVLLHSVSGHPAWIHHEIPWPTAYASIVAWRRDSLVVCFAGADPSRRGDVNSLFITISADGGSTWSSPELLSHGANRVAVAPLMIVAASGELDLVTGQFGQGGGSIDVLKRWRSHDGGRNWLPLHDAPLNRAQVIRFVAMSTRCGVLEAVVESLMVEGNVLRPVLDEVPWDGDRATTTQLFVDFRAATSAALSGDGDRIRLIAAVANPPATSVGTVTTIRQECPPEH